MKKKEQQKLILLLILIFVIGIALFVFYKTKKQNVKENFSLSKIFKKIFKKNDLNNPMISNINTAQKTLYRNIAKQNMPLIKKQNIRSARRIGFEDLDDYISRKSNKSNEILKPLKKFEPKISADSDVARPPLSKTIDGSGDIEAI